MEVGAVKQAFNNEIILLKKCLNQAKIQTIHKLTRKAKTLTEKKVPEPQKDKLKRKAESAVKEVLIIKAQSQTLQAYSILDAAPDWTILMDTYEKHYEITEDINILTSRPDIFLSSKHTKRTVLVELTVLRETNIPKDHAIKENKYYDLTNELTKNGYVKIKARDIARFTVTHAGNLNDFLNKPTVDNDKACARLLLHKALKDKYKQIREKFLNVSIKDLFMSRQERRKLKKEAMDKQKDKKKGKDKPGAVNVQGEWDIEMTDEKVKVMPGDDTTFSHNDSEGDVNDAEEHDDGDAEEVNDDEDDDDNSSEVHDESGIEDSNVSESDEPEENIVNSTKQKSFKPKLKDNVIAENRDEDSDTGTTKSKAELPKNIINISSKKNSNTSHINKNVDKKINTKNKNLNIKLEKRNFNKESDEASTKATKIVDPFFITSTGENYMSLVEPRQPDEVKEVHREGNRQYRRAVMFGHAPKIRPNRNSFEPRNNKFQKQNSYENNNKNFNNNYTDKNQGYTHDRNRNPEKRFNKEDTVPEKLHPSWEAKKKQSGILPFTGKKIVFDES